MAMADDLRVRLETHETETVGNAFGGAGAIGVFSVPAIRDWVLTIAPFDGEDELEGTLHRARGLFGDDVFSVLVASLIRFSFLIELTKLDVGSTKMKTRWLAGNIQMSQPDSFVKYEGQFRPGTDPRAASFDTCLSIFVRMCTAICDEQEADGMTSELISRLNSVRRVPYEIPLTYVDAELEPLHTPENVAWSPSDDVRWLIEARSILRKVPADLVKPIRKIEKLKLRVKVFLTDRCLTGKDKTNRAKRWEVLCGDFQHATIHQCWSVERKLTTDLIFFEGFPAQIRASFEEQGLVFNETPVTRCPVTLAPVDYTEFSKALLDPAHGVSDYQVGHLHPLKQGGTHDGENVSWQSADGNRIQGDLTIEEIHKLLQAIEERRNDLG